MAWSAICGLVGPGGFGSASPINVGSAVRQVAAGAGADVVRRAPGRETAADLIEDL
jgi:anthranilate phosphoribosyltransferase